MTNLLIENTKWVEFIFENLFLEYTIGNLTLMSNKKIIAHKTNEEIKVNLKKLKANLGILNQERLRMKYNYDLEKDTTYRKMISDLHIKTLVNMADNSPILETQKWGMKLRGLAMQDEYH